MIGMVYDWAYHIAGKKLLFFFLAPFFMTPWTIQAHEGL
jgi:hypothetical protein